MPTHNPCQLVDISSIKSACKGCSLFELCLPYGVDHKGLEALERIIRQKRPLKGGSFVYRVGDPLRALYAVRSGAVKTYIISDEGRQQITGFHLPGELLGLDAIATNQHACFAYALDTTSICEIPFERLEEAARNVPEIQRQLLRLMSHEIAEDERMLLLLGQKPADERLAVFLLRLSQRYAQLGYSPQEFELQMSRTDIANYLGLAVETVSRLFTRFQSEGLLTVKNRYLHVNDLAKLRNAAGIVAQCVSHQSPR